MAAFGADGRCLMRALREELDDPDPQDCGVCAVCTAPRYDGPLDPALVRDAALHLRSRPLLLDVKKMAPDPEGKMKQARRRRARRGGPRARAARRRRLGPADPGGPPRGALRRRAGRGRRRGRAHVARAGALGRGGAVQAQRRRSCPDFAQRLAAALELPFHPVLERVGDNPPQREMTNSVQQVANVRGEFAVVAGPPAGRRACSSTTSASAAGRWRWSRASCAARARARSTRSRSRRRSR